MTSITTLRWVFTKNIFATQIKLTDASYKIKRKLFLAFKDCDYVLEKKYVLSN